MIAQKKRLRKIFELFLIFNEADGIDAESRKFESIVEGMTLYTAEQIQAALEQAGFQNVRTVHHETKPWIAVLAKKGTREDTGGLR